MDPRIILSFMLGIPLVGPSPGGCGQRQDWGDDDEVDVEAPEFNGPELIHSWPEDGSDDFLHRDTVELEFRGPVDLFWLNLVDEWGNVIDGDLEFSADLQWVTFDPYGEGADMGLEPSSGYTLLLEWNDRSATIDFVTHEFGEPIWNLEQEVVGNDYVLELSSVHFTEPYGAAETMEEFYAGQTSRSRSRPCRTAASRPSRGRWSVSERSTSRTCVCPRASSPTRWISGTTPTSTWDIWISPWTSRGSRWTTRTRM